MLTLPSKDFAVQTVPRVARFGTQYLVFVSSIYISRGEIPQVAHQVDKTCPEQPLINPWYSNTYNHYNHMPRRVGFSFPSKPKDSFLTTVHLPIIVERSKTTRLMIKKSVRVDEGLGQSLERSVLTRCHFHSRYLVSVSYLSK